MRLVDYRELWPNIVLRTTIYFAIFLILEFFPPREKKKGRSVLRPRLRYASCRVCLGIPMEFGIQRPRDTPTLFAYTQHVKAHPNPPHTHTLIQYVDGGGDIS
jgi:hypothetical protein